MNGRGRPPKPEMERMAPPIGVRFLIPETDDLYREAMKLGVPLPAYIRDLVRVARANYGFSKIEKPRSA